MDIWGLGCVWFEILTLDPLFPGESEVDQIDKIHSVIGTPSDKLVKRLKKFPNEEFDFKFSQKKGSGIRKLLPDTSLKCVDLITKLLKYDPEKRITCA
jgi:renal tumor antigen